MITITSLMQLSFLAYFFKCATHLNAMIKSKKMVQEREFVIKLPHFKTSHQLQESSRMKNVF